MPKCKECLIEVKSDQKAISFMGMIESKSIGGGETKEYLIRFGL